MLSNNSSISNKLLFSLKMAIKYCFTQDFTNQSNLGSGDHPLFGMCSWKLLALPQGMNFLKDANLSMEGWLQSCAHDAN